MGNVKAAKVAELEKYVERLGEMLGRTVVLDRAYGGYRIQVQAPGSSAVEKELSPRLTKTEVTVWLDGALEAAEYMRRGRANPRQGVPEGVPDVDDYYMDESYASELRAAGIPAHSIVDTYEGIAYQVTALYDGAVEDDWLVGDRATAERQAEYLASREDKSEPVEYIVSEVYVGPDTIEGSGYGVDSRYTAAEYGEA